MQRTKILLRTTKAPLRWLSFAAQFFPCKSSLSTLAAVLQARIRTNMHGTLTRKFVDLMAEYQQLQTKYKNKYRERVERQAPMPALPLLIAPVAATHRHILGSIYLAV